MQKAYESTNIPVSRLGLFIRLCLTDSNFPSFVEAVEKELSELVSAKWLHLWVQWLIIKSNLRTRFDLPRQGNARKGKELKAIGKEGKGQDRKGGMWRERKEGKEKGEPKTEEWSFSANNQFPTLISSFYLKYRNFPWNFLEKISQCWGNQSLMK